MSHNFNDYKSICNSSLVFSAIPIYDFNDNSKTNILKSIKISFLDFNGDCHQAELEIKNPERPTLKDIINYVVNLYELYYADTNVTSITLLTNDGAMLFSMLSDFRELSKNKFYYVYQNKEPVVMNKKIKLASLNNKEIRFSSYDISLYGAKNISDTSAIIDYFYNFMLFCKTDLSVNVVPPNIPKLAELYIHNLANANNISSEEMKGTTKADYCEYINGKKQKSSISLIAQNDGVISDIIIQNCFSGGYNCCFVYKDYKCADDEIIIDCDLSSCYPTMLSAKNNANYEDIKSDFFTGYTITSLDDLSNNLRKALFDVSIYCFCYVQFSFDDDVIYPTLPVKCNNKDKGLYYVRNGYSFCTGAELLTTLLFYEGKVKIQIKNVVVIGTTENNIYFDAYEKLLKMRKIAKANGDNLKADTIKSICNTGYGKTAQGIASESNLSKITNVLYAADATGTARAVLNSLISIFAKHNIKIIDVITDGLKIVVQKPNNFDELYDYENNILKVEDVNAYLSKELLEEINSNVVVQLFKNTNNRLTDCKDNSYIKVKHIGDSINYYHNKCYVMRYKDKVQHRISAGIKTTTGEEVDMIFNNEKVEKWQYQHRITLNELLNTDNDYKDIYAIIKENTPTIAPDSKRNFQSDGNNLSLPWSNISEAVIADSYIQDRKKSKKKKITTPEDISYHQNMKAKNQTIKTKRADKILWRAITQRKGIFSKLLKGLTDKDIKQKLSLTKDNFNNAKRLVFVPNVIVDTEGNRDIIASICSKLDIDLNLEDIFNLALVR